MLEADPTIIAEVAVYDPQSAFDPEPFDHNGSQAARLAVVANVYEARRLTGNKGTDSSQLAALVRSVANAEVAVVKGGAFGTWVADRGGTQHIPCRVTEQVWSLGSGDVFASVFALRWGVEGTEPAVAAEEASRGVAEYVDTRYPPSRSAVADGSKYPTLVIRSPAPGQQVYIAAPFFTMAQRWNVDEIREAIPKHFKVFSPLHDVGRGPASTVAPLDLEAIKSSAAIIAVLDGHDSGTLFEVGYARALGIPVVAIAESFQPEELVMLRGSDCTVTTDIASAVYHLVWNVLRGARNFTIKA
jgi:nucleoside 2-deoxyribosyltransferase